MGTVAPKTNTLHIKTLKHFYEPFTGHILAGQIISSLKKKLINGGNDHLVKIFKINFEL